MHYSKQILTKTAILRIIGPHINHNSPALAGLLCFKCSVLAVSYSPCRLRQVPSPLGGLTSEFGMGSGGTSSLWSPEIGHIRHCARNPCVEPHRPSTVLWILCCGHEDSMKRIRRQAARPISTARLVALHLRPINLVVFEGS